MTEQKQYSSVARGILDARFIAQANVDKFSKIHLAALENAMMDGWSNASKETLADIEQKQKQHDDAVELRRAVDTDVESLRTIIVNNWPDDFPLFSRFCRHNTTTNREGLDREIEILANRLEQIELLPVEQPQPYIPVETVPATVEDKMDMETSAEHVKGWHSADDAPPDDFHQEPITGTLKELAIAFDGLDGDPRNVPAKLGSARWGRKNHRTSYSVYFRSATEFNRMQAKMPQTTPNSTKKH